MDSTPAHPVDHCIDCMSDAGPCAALDIRGMTTYRVQAAMVVKEAVVEVAAWLLGPPALASSWCVALLLGLWRRPGKKEAPVGSFS